MLNFTTKIAILPQLIWQIVVNTLSLHRESGEMRCKYKSFSPSFQIFTSIKYVHFTLFMLFRLTKRKIVYEKNQKHQGYMPAA